MIHNSNILIRHLPLSWIRSRTKYLSFKTHLLKRSHLKWVSLVEVPVEMSFQHIISTLKSDTSTGLIIRGCDNQIASYLKEADFEILAMGQEAVLDLKNNPFDRKSLLDLVKRGSKKVIFKRVDDTSLNRKKLEQLKRQSRHGNKPQLKYLFWNSYFKNSECFVCETEKGQWIGALTISVTTSEKVHTELLLRHAQATNGMMEALIFYVYRYLKSKNYRYWSLGEVPFIMSPDHYKNLKTRILSACGKRLSFAYNAYSLFNFKNKFKPVWQTIYLCGYPKISLLSVFEMALKSNFIKLILYQAIKRLAVWNRN